MATKLTTFQPFSIYGGGGGSRILRRLFEGNENNIGSVGVGIPQKNNIGLIKETLIQEFPKQHSWMRSYIRIFFSFLRNNVFVANTLRKIRIQVGLLNPEILHIIDHGYYPSALLPLKAGVRTWVSFHDHFISAGENGRITSELWNNSERRLMISKELGHEYQRLFGIKPFEVITDGVDESEISSPKKIDRSKTITIYFAGLLHIDYLPLFRTLAEALDQLSNEYNFKLILRGTQYVDFLDGRNFVVQFLPQTLDSVILKEEMDNASMLYLPIKFTVPEFYLYSLSTKMVGYLGGAGPILYHGPENSAAFNLLNEHKSAIGCTSLDTSKMTLSIKELLNIGFEVSENAKLLARNQFALKKIRANFWQENNVAN